MDKDVLIQYCEIKEEIKDIRRRIMELDKFLAHPPIVSDTVRGSRRDGTIGSIKITGIPDPLYYRKERQRDRYRKILQDKEAELLDLTCEVEKHIESISSSELRIMLRFYFVDGLSYAMVAQCMNRMFPKRTVKYTDENIRKRIQRRLEIF